MNINDVRRHTQLLSVGYYNVKGPDLQRMYFLSHKFYLDEAEDKVEKQSA